MRGKMYVISEQGLKLLISSKRKYLFGIGALVLILILLVGYTLKLKHQLAAQKAAQAGVYDELYDRMMQEFEAVKHDPHLRRYIIAKVISQAEKYDIDPDLLFALVAIESGFNVVARSPKNARGLGQVMFATAKGIDPTRLDRPDELYDVHLNLHYTLEYLKANLEESGDVRTALMVYYYGGAAKARGFKDRSKYVSKVLSYYALVKARRWGGGQADSNRKLLRLG